MEVNSIEWHENRFKNISKGYEKENEKLKKLLEKVCKMKSQLSFYEYQIGEAKVEGKNKFDRNKFRVKKISYK